MNTKQTRDNICTYTRGQINTLSLDMTKRICHFIGRNFSQFQALSGHFVNKKLKII